MKKVLVTGANGFLGVNLVRALQQDYAVSIFVRRNADLANLQGLQVHTMYGNIDDREQVFKAIEGHDYVIHSASVTEQYGIEFEQYERINVTATRHIAEACLHHKIQKLIYVSSANTIGPGSIKEPGTELNGFFLFKAKSGYINSKYLAQQLILEQVVQKQLPAVIINPTFMIGAYDSKPSSGQIILYGLNKMVLFYPPGGKNFVHIQDVCQGIINAITRGEKGGCYLLAGENLSYRNFFKELNKISHQHPLMIKIPVAVLKAGGLIGSIVQKVTHRSKRLSQSSAYMLCLDNYYTGKKSEKELGLQYKPIADAISQAYHWFNGRDR